MKSFHESQTGTAALQLVKEQRHDLKAPSSAATATACPLGLLLPNLSPNTSTTFAPARPPRARRRTSTTFPKRSGDLRRAARHQPTRQASDGFVPRRSPAGGGSPRPAGTGPRRSARRSAAASTPAAAVWYPAGWLFSSPAGSWWDPDNFSPDLADANRAAALRWSCLDYRHSFGSHLGDEGESLNKIASLIGTRQKFVRRRYTVLSPKHAATVEFSRDGVATCCSSDTYRFRHEP